MNYLAHILLSGDDEEVLVGNIMEDYVNGRIDHPRNSHLSRKVKIGLGLHRYIDTKMDTDELVKEGKYYFYPKFSKYSSAVMDIVFDYFLSKNWETYSSVPLNAFGINTYEKLNRNIHIMPDSMKLLVSNMKDHNWLVKYGDLASLRYVMGRFTLKVNKPSFDFTEAIDIVIKHEKELNTIFNVFFPQMVQECSTYLKLNLKDGEID